MNLFKTYYNKLFKKKKPIFNNKFSMGPDEWFHLVKGYFSDEMPGFQLIDEYKDNSGHWGHTYSNESFLISINYDMGFLEYNFSFEGKKIYVEDYYPEVVEIKAASEVNLKYILNAFKKIVSKLERGGK